MSLLSQFFPSGGGGIGGGTVPVEILGISGGGGGGAGHWCNSPYAPGPTGCRTGASGGMGAFFYASNYYLNPGTTYSICIGSGGAGGIACAPTGSTTRGSNGGFTSFNNPVCQLRVEGGGGGGASPAPASPGVSNGLPGGTGGGGVQSSGGSGLYLRMESVTRTITSNIFRNASTPTGTCICTDNLYLINHINGELEPTPWGVRGGFPGSSGWTYPNPSPGFNIQTSGCGGGMVSNATVFCCYFVNPFPAFVNTSTGPYCNASGYDSNITGSLVSYGSTVGARGSGGSGLPGINCYVSGCPGGAGALIIKWPSGALGAAPPTGFPGGTNISPQTPGYNTYCFTSSGSITLP